MSKVVLVQTLNENAAVFIVDVAYGGCLVQSSSSTVSCGSSSWHLLERGYLLVEVYGERPDRSSRGDVNPHIALRLWPTCPCEKRQGR
ncbi:hypothetical protein CRG98_021172 [Punica granatum]|uniref:Uncharacterized protein n=1 Tax=Punica granatum TaxID=22663 RepID=A0A2I0JQ37_PUNGR|nr:hypothetical protein CRG98_021172 [Punica granatum]